MITRISLRTMLMVHACVHALLRDGIFFKSFWICDTNFFGQLFVEKIISNDGLKLVFFYKKLPKEICVTYPKGFGRMPRLCGGHPTRDP